MILIRAKLQEILRNFFGEEIGGSGALGPPNEKMENKGKRRCNNSLVFARFLLRIAALLLVFAMFC